MPAVLPTRSDVHGVNARRQFPVARDPNVSTAFIPPVARDPHVAPRGTHRDDLGARRRRRYFYDDFPRRRLHHDRGGRRRRGRGHDDGAARTWTFFDDAAAEQRQRGERQHAGRDAGVKDAGGVFHGDKVHP